MMFLWKGFSFYNDEAYYNGQIAQKTIQDSRVLWKLWRVPVYLFTLYGHTSLGSWFWGPVCMAGSTGPDTNIGSTHGFDGSSSSSTWLDLKLHRRHLWTLWVRREWEERPNPNVSWYCLQYGVTDPFRGKRRNQLRTGFLLFPIPGHGCTVTCCLTSAAVSSPKR